MALAIALFVGCNTVCPVITAGAANAAIAQDENCHHSNPKGTVTGSACKSSCLAIAPAITAITSNPAIKGELLRHSPQELLAHSSSPEPPPPRA